ncbi:hypothetical protein FisN_19Lh064 [Fistulifera solaris]|uniref:GH16 domain-containing protein n=1 Tax=Fistulifera solaris TaxID=1519565 RepID=A0A1Z5JR39_FISSO|nr:hypothetical protein FisN_19Lh064 [Fistulifera solaris]|eukprot:GAX16484.1 hypothetical protein FisN_19Lh064 [Fistulifera solaris]
MAPNESTALLSRDKDDGDDEEEEADSSSTSCDHDIYLSIDGQHSMKSQQHHHRQTLVLCSSRAMGFLFMGIVTFLLGWYARNQQQQPSNAKSHSHNNNTHYTGPFQLIELQQGANLLNYYDFLDGPDSAGSAGFQTYVSRRRAHQLQLLQIHPDGALIMKSAPNAGNKRFSIRLEGKRRFNRGLFVLHVDHIPAGCGTWPAFWLTDEDHWPYHGEIDIVEGVNDQSHAKTALHTAESCSMYAQVPPYAQTGEWDRSTGIPNTYTGILDHETSVPADNCWVLAPHQWSNQGCVVTHSHNNTLGARFNEQGGGIYVLDWDPDHGYIKSWVFPQSQGYPANLEQATLSAESDSPVAPNPNDWHQAPYAYFAIGANSSCSSDHFSNMRLIFNLAFCGTVAGNRFVQDCPDLAAQFAVKDDVVATCNAYVASEPEALEEAYWKIKGVYVYQRGTAR